MTVDHIEKSIYQINLSPEEFTALETLCHECPDIKEEVVCFAASCCFLSTLEKLKNTFFK